MADGIQLRRIAALAAAVACGGLVVVGFFPAPWDFLPRAAKWVLCALLTFWLLRSVLPQCLANSRRKRHERPLFDGIGRHRRLDSAAAWPLGHGLGDRAVRPILTKADKEGQHVSLHSTNPRNLSFYARHGFREVASTNFPGAVVCVALVRCPKSCPSTPNQCRAAAAAAANHHLQPHSPGHPST